MGIVLPAQRRLGLIPALHGDPEHNENNSPSTVDMIPKLIKNATVQIYLSASLKKDFSDKD